MGMRGFGLTSKSIVKPILGFSDAETVKLDFDNTPFEKVKYWARRAMRRYGLEGFIILKSSKNSYHVVFNRKVSWSENMRSVAWVSLESHIGGLTRYLQMQCIKQSSTLRVSGKQEKRPPRVVYREGKQDKQIMNYLNRRRVIRELDKRLSLMA
jgi:hypothetical protein